MPAGEYAKGLAGLSLNLIVKDVVQSLAFYEQVLLTDVVYSDVDFAVLHWAGDSTGVEPTRWLLHALHTYDQHPLYARLCAATLLGSGAEFRLHHFDPDAAQQRAIAGGFAVLSPASDKAHGLRETFLEDPDGYVWVPDYPLA